MTFPLLRLPLLASTRIIKYIDVGCLIPLIQLSKNSKNLVKLSKVHIKLTVFQSSIQFKKLARQDGELECVDLSEKTPKNLPFEPPCHLKFETKMQYQIGAYKKVLDDFVEFFKVCSVSFDLETACSYTSLCFMEYAKNLGLRLRTVRVVIGGANGKVYQSLLKLCSNASQLLVLYDTHENFKFDGFNENIMDRLRITDKKRQTEKYFYSRGINWFTVDHMCALVNCSKVSLKGLNWRSLDINRFIKFWLASDGKKLQSLVYKNSVSQLQIFPQLMMKGINNREIGFTSYEIQRADGVRAKVEYGHWRFKLTVIDA